MDLVGKDERVDFGSIDVGARRGSNRSVILVVEDLTSAALLASRRCRALVRDDIIPRRISGDCRANLMPAIWRGSGIRRVRVRLGAFGDILDLKVNRNVRCASDKVIGRDNLRVGCIDKRLIPVTTVGSLYLDDICESEAAVLLDIVFEGRNFVVVLCAELFLGRRDSLFLGDGRRGRRNVGRTYGA